MLSLLDSEKVSLDDSVRNVNYPKTMRRNLKVAIHSFERLNMMGNAKKLTTSLNFINTKEKSYVRTLFHINFNM